MQTILSHFRHSYRHDTVFRLRERVARARRRTTLSENFECTRNNCRFIVTHSRQCRSKNEEVIFSGKPACCGSPFAWCRYANKSPEHTFRLRQLYCACAAVCCMRASTQLKRVCALFLVCVGRGAAVVSYTTGSVLRLIGIAGRRSGS
jgi:hypothetical protein